MRVLTRQNKSQLLKCLQFLWSSVLCKHAGSYKFPHLKKKTSPPKINMLFTCLGRSVWEKTVPYSRPLQGADPGEVKWVNFHPRPLFLSPLHTSTRIWFYYIITKIKSPPFQKLQKFTTHFKILDPRLLGHSFFPYGPTARLPDCPVTYEYDILIYLNIFC